MRIYNALTEVAQADLKPLDMLFFPKQFIVGVLNSY